MIKKLKEVAKVNEISISSKSYPANIYYIDIASVDNGFITAAQEIKFSEAPTRARRIVKNKDILLSTVRPNLRHYAFVQNAKDNTIASTGFAVISCKNINPRFLYYFLTSNNVTDYLSAIAESHTSTYPSFPPEILEELEIPFPSEDEQEKIANILGTLDDKIELNRQMNQTLEAMARAIFKSWFVDFDPVYAKMEGRDYPLPPETMDLFPDEMEESELGLIPKGWRVGTIGDIADNLKYVVHPNEVNEATYYIGLEHMPRKNIALDTWDYSEKVTSNKYAFSKGNILFGKLRPYFHKVGITPVDGICSTDIIVVNGKDNDYQNFLLFLLSSTVFVDSVSAASTGTKMPRTDWKYMQSYEIPLPPEIILQKFNSIVKSMVEKIVLNIHTSKNLENFRDVLLPKLIKGELDL